MFDDFLMAKQRQAVADVLTRSENVSALLRDGVPEDSFSVQRLRLGVELARLRLGMWRSFWPLASFVGLFWLLALVVGLLVGAH